MKLPTYLFFAFLFISFQIKSESHTDSLLNKVERLADSKKSYEALEIIDPLYYETLYDSSISPQFFEKLAFHYIQILELADQNEEAVYTLLDLLDEHEFQDSTLASLHLVAARLYEKIGQPEETWRHVQKAGKLLTTNMPTHIHATYYIRLSSYHRQFEDKARALKYALKATKYDNIRNTDAYFLVGYLLPDDSLELKIKYVKQAIKGFKELEDTSSLGYMYTSLYKYYHQLNMPDISEAYIDSSRAMFYSSSLPGDREALSSLLRDYYIEKGMLDSALHYSEETQNWYREDQKLNNQATIFLSEAKFKRDRLEKQLMDKQLLLEQQQLIYHIERRNNIILTFLLLSIGVLTFVSIAFAVAQVKKKKQLGREAITIKEKNTALERALKNNKMLNKEMNHRVKNNLAMLIGMLEIQKSHTGEVALKTIIDQIIGRVHAISAIHKNLYQQGESASMSTAVIFEQLIEYQRELLPAKFHNRIEYLIDDVPMSISIILPLSLMLHELLTNACKYALRTEKDQVRVKFTYKSGTACLLLEDTGPGIAEDHEMLTSNTFGLYLVKLMAEQLKGTFIWKKISGLFIIKVKINMILDETKHTDSRR